MKLLQEEVSKTMEAIFMQNLIPNLIVSDTQTNGVPHRLYELNGQKTFVTAQAPIIPQYAVKFGGVTISGTADDIQDYADAHNIPIRYSESKDCFYNLMEVNVEYLKNIYAKEITDLATNNVDVKTNRADVKMALNSQILKAVVARYDEIMLTM